MTRRAGAAMGGGFGFSVLKLDDGRVIAHILKEGGAAARAGMVWGAELLEWQGQPINDAVTATSTLWASRPPETNEAIAIHKHLLLTRAATGTERSVTFRNPGDIPAQTLTLRASSSDSSYSRALDWQMYKATGTPVSWRILESPSLATFVLQS